MKMEIVYSWLAVTALTFTCSLADNSYGAYGTNFFAESSNTYYSGYQQAWRYLGWYVKCGDPSDRYEEEDSHENSHDSHDSGENRWEGNNWCQRYLVWAAYVDENYQGGGIGEYAIYDPYDKQWDTSACDAHGNGRCAPMDCHMNNSTTWTLMGVFKEASYFGNDAFFEQLFKHEGVCLMNDDDLYEFMSDARENAWPQGCVSTGIKISDSYYSSSSTSGYNDYVYIDLKPTYNGNMTYGLYTDSTCKYEYELTDNNVETIAKSMGLLYGDYLETWNDALEIYKVCQPCKTYNLKNDYAVGNYYGEYADDSDPNEGYFECYDDADYTNVNQCMKFRTHAELEVATWEDLVTATNQGGILQVNISGTVFGSERMSAEDYKYLLKMRQEEVQRTVSLDRQYRLESAKVERMGPSVRSWLALGSLFLLSGIAAMVGSLFLVRKHYINRTNQRLTQPLLVSKRGGNGGSQGAKLRSPPRSREQSMVKSMGIVSPQAATGSGPPVDEQSTRHEKKEPGIVSTTESESTVPRGVVSVSSMSDDSEDDKKRPTPTKKKLSKFSLFKKKTPVVEASRTENDSRCESPVNPVSRAGAFEMNPDGSPVFLSHSYMSEEEVANTEPPSSAPATTAKPLARTGAIEMNDDGSPFFQSHSYVSDSNADDVVMQSRVDSADDVVMKTRTFDD